MPECVSTSASHDPFTFRRPKLFSHKAGRQVAVSLARNDEAEGDPTPCILKFFSPKCRTAFERELSIYNCEEIEESRPQKLWSGTWASSKYSEFIGNLPSILRKSDSLVYILVLSYVEGFEAFIPSQPIELQKHAVKAALLSLQKFHSAGIIHGDVSVDNLLLQNNGDRLEAIWIDFSSSIVNASAAMTRHEWEQAVTYFSDLVNELNELANTDSC